MTLQIANTVIVYEPPGPLFDFVLKLLYVYVLSSTPRKSICVFF